MKSITLQNVSFSYYGCADLFAGLTVTFHNDSVVAIVGDNGCGKSTLLKIIAGQLQATTGRVIQDARIAYVPQLSPHGNKSGGQHQMSELMRAFDTGADIILFDEPTNNLDGAARALFFDRLARYPGGAIIVSHDRELLRHVDAIYELSNGKLTVYGGGYDFYVATRQAARRNLESKYTDTQKRIAELTRTVAVAQNTRQHHESKQKKEITNARRSRLEANALRGKSQETEARLRRNIQKKLNQQLDIQQSLSAIMRDDTIKIPMPSKPFYSKDLVFIQDLDFSYGDRPVLKKFNFVMHGGGRVLLSGRNGCGKSTLLKIICGQLQPSSGTVKTFGNIAYLNQDLSLLNPDCSVVENIMNVSGMLAHDAHAIAANFGFRGDTSRQLVGTLSGGELLRATLAAVLGGVNQPDLLILDEPTNNLDMKSVGVLESALSQYRGAILLVSHDADFVRSVAPDRTVEL